MSRDQRRYVVNFLKVKEKCLIYDVMQAESSHAYKREWFESIGIRHMLLEQKFIDNSLSLIQRIEWMIIDRSFFHHEQEKKIIQNNVALIELIKQMKMKVTLFMLEEDDLIELNKLLDKSQYKMKKPWWRLF